MTPLGRNIRDRRGRLGLSQAELASECGLDAETVSRVETGLVAKPQAATVARLAKALKTTVAVLEGRESASPEANGSAAGRGSVAEPLAPDAEGVVTDSHDQARSDLPKSLGQSTDADGNVSPAISPSSG